MWTEMCNTHHCREVPRPADKPAVATRRTSRSKLPVPPAPAANGQPKRPSGGLWFAPETIEQMNKQRQELLQQQQKQEQMQPPSDKT